jgi:hypothetical protein
VIKPEDIVKHVMAEIDCVREDCVKESMEQPSESVQFSEQQQSAPPNHVGALFSVENFLYLLILFEILLCSKGKK